LSTSAARSRRIDQGSSELPGVHGNIGLMPILETSVVVAVPNQVSSSLGDEAVILELTQGIYYGLNEVGARIWMLLKQPRRAGEIRDVILDEYEVKSEAGTRDVLALLTELAERGLIEVRNGKAP
jgi:hypothetical protein